MIACDLSQLDPCQTALMLQTTKRTHVALHAFYTVGVLACSCSLLGKIALVVASLRLQHHLFIVWQMYRHTQL